MLRKTQIRGTAANRGRRDRIGAALLYCCAAGAALSAVGAVGAVSRAVPAVRSVETWRLIGLATFAGIFALLASAPRRLRGLWELVIAAKLALPIAGATFLRGAPEATTFVVADGALVVILLAAYMLTSGWAAWRDSEPAKIEVGRQPKIRTVLGLRSYADRWSGGLHRSR